MVENSEKDDEVASEEVATNDTGSEKIDGTDYAVYGEWQIIDNYGDESGESCYTDNPSAPSDND